MEDLLKCQIMLNIVKTKLSTLITTKNRASTSSMVYIYYTFLYDCSFRTPAVIDAI